MRCWRTPLPPCWTPPGAESTEAPTTRAAWLAAVLNQPPKPWARCPPRGWTTRHGRCCPASPPRRTLAQVPAALQTCAAGGPAAPGCGRGGADPAHCMTRDALLLARRLCGRPPWDLGRATLQPALAQPFGARVGLPAHARTGLHAVRAGVPLCDIAPLAARQCAGAGGAGR